jgi:hypothetical protein
MAFVCRRCGKNFRDRAHLARHESKQRLCQRDTSSHACECGKRYTNRSNLHRHRKACSREESAGSEAVGPVQHITIHNAQVITVQGDLNNVGSQTNILSACLPGWPEKWPAPQSLPRPFLPPGFTITADILRQAFGSSTSDAEACLRGDPAAVASLLVEIVKLVHSDPHERNIYLNPKRVDQVLVYVPERWQVLRLKEGIRHILGHVVDELEEAVPRGDGRLLRLAHGARTAFLDKKEEVMRSSRGAMETHLENMQIRSSTSENDWLGTFEGGTSNPTREFGRERHGHLSSVAVVSALENALGVYSVEDFARENISAMARKALVVVARMLLTGKPENLTVLLLCDGSALIRGERGWVTSQACVAAAAQVTRVAFVVADCIRGQDSTPLSPLVGFFEQHTPSLAAEEGSRLELLTQYSLAAERYYSRTSGPENSMLRLRIAEKESALRELAAATMAGPPEQSDLDRLFLEIFGAEA